MNTTFSKGLKGLVLLAVALTRANAADLTVGDTAPKLQVSKWVQGDAVKEFDREHAYIVEFWATWCGPCRVSIPHLNEIHTKFKGKGLIVIGQDVWENDVTLVEPFVKKMGDKMTYRVALDTVEGEKKGKMAETWMEAAGQNGIPTAFVIDKSGKIAWIGHPMELKEELLEKVLDGKFDIKTAAEEYAKEHKMEELLSAAQRELNQQLKAKEWDKAEATINRMRDMMPEDRRAWIEMKRFDVLVQRKDFKRAFALAEELTDANQDKAMLQNEVAWTLVASDAITEPPLELAEKIIRRANKTTEEKNSEILDTLGRVLYLKGEKQKAIEIEENAVKFAEGQRKAEFERVLASYKEGKLPKVE